MNAEFIERFQNVANLFDSESGKDWLTKSKNFVSKSESPNGGHSFCRALKRVKVSQSMVRSSSILPKASIIFAAALSTAGLQFEFKQVCEN